MNKQTLSLLVIALVLLAGCAGNGPIVINSQVINAPEATTVPVSTQVTSTDTAVPAVATITPAIDPSLAPFLPRPELTPGTTDPRVSQADISSTICKRGYTASIRPDVSITEPMKRQSIIDYGLADRRLGDYEFDHDVPLELGGNPVDPKNLWPEPLAGKWGAPIKDQLENKLNQMVCDGQLPLVVAQQAFETNWIAAYEKYVGGN